MSFHFFDRAFLFFGDSAQWNKAMNMMKSYLWNKKWLAIFFILFVLFILVCLIAEITNSSVLESFIRTHAWMLYLFFVVILTILNRDTGVRELRLTFDPWFASDTSFHESNVLISILDGILFFPFGYLVKKKFKFFPSVLLVIFTAFAIEAAQYIWQKGVTSVEDLASYVVGGFIGLLFYCIVHRSWRKEKKNVPFTDE